MAVGKREVGDGVGIDATNQHIADAPAYNDPNGETVGVVDDTETGEETVEGVDAARRPDGPGQSTLDDWRWST